MWLLNTTRLYVQQLGNSEGEIIPRLQPLNNRTQLQFFGRESPVIKVEAKVVGTTNLESIRTLKRNQTVCTLSGYDFYYGTVYVRGFEYQIDPATLQTIDTTQDCETPVYTLTLELYQDA
jgi:hypothetical protein